MATGHPITRWGTDPVQGTQPEDVRQMVAAAYHSYGIISGCEVSTSATAMAYTVASGVAVGTRGESYGAVLSRVPAGTVTTGAAPASGSRIDVVYALQHDSTQGDADGFCVLAVAQGSAGASPAKPSVPIGGIELAAFVVPTGITTTAGANTYGILSYAIPYGGNLGILLKSVDTSNDTGSSSWMTVTQGTFDVPIQRYIRADITTSLQGVVPNDGTPTEGSCYMRLMLDGVQIRSWERILNTTAASDYYSEIFGVGAGEHTAALQIRDGTSGWRRYYGADSWPGQSLIISDQGIQ